MCRLLVPISLALLNFARAVSRSGVLVSPYRSISFDLPIRPVSVKSRNRLTFFAITESDRGNAYFAGSTPRSYHPQSQHDFVK